MFERFTERARSVVVLAQEEARGLDHEAIGTEHVLLALLHDETSIAGRVLTGLGLTLDGMRAEVVAVVGRGRGTPVSSLPFSPQAKKLLELSLRQALQLGHNYIGTEHLLLALVGDVDTLGAQLLVRHGADQAVVRVAVTEALPLAGPPGAPRPSGPKLDRCSFCGRTSASVALLLRGEGGVGICDRCVADAAHIIEQARAEDDEPTGPGPQRPPDEP